MAPEVGQLSQGPHHGAAGQVDGASLEGALESFGSVSRPVDGSGEEDTGQDPVVSRVLEHIEERHSTRREAVDKDRLVLALEVVSDHECNRDDLNVRDLVRSIVLLRR